MRTTTEKLADKALADGQRQYARETKRLLRKAAPAMLAALQAIDQGFRDGSIKWAKPRKSDSDPYHPANTLMCQAIAEATGEA